MGAFLKKDLLCLLRDRSELYLLILMPLILIIILGFALGGFFVGNNQALSMKVAIVQEDDENKGISQFVEELQQIGMPEEAITELQAAAKEVSPYSVLKAMLENESLSNLINTVSMDRSNAEQELKDGELTAILTIPENFTYQALTKTLLGEGETSSILLTVNDQASLRAGIFEDIIEAFVYTFNFETAINRSTMHVNGEVVNREAVEIGGIETVSKRNPINSFQYYTIGMAVMFVLYIGASIASYAYVEKQQHVFNRILLSNKHPLLYLLGKFISAMVIAMMQITILFTVTSLIFQPLGEFTLNFWLGIALISIILAMCVGTLGALMTAIIVRFDSQGAIGIFSGGVVTIFAFLGGSFFPTADLHPVISQLGNWTPNGAALSAYLQWMQGLPLEFLISPLIRIAFLALLFLAISVFIFPKRRSV